MLGTRRAQTSRRRFQSIAEPQKMAPASARQAQTGQRATAPRRKARVASASFTRSTSERSIRASRRRGTCGSRTRSRFRATCCSELCASGRPPSQTPSPRPTCTRRRFQISCSRGTSTSLSITCTNRTSSAGRPSPTASSRRSGPRVWTWTRPAPRATCAGATRRRAAPKATGMLACLVDGCNRRGT